MVNGELNDNSEKLRYSLQLIVDRLAVQPAIASAEIIYFDCFDTYFNILSLPYFPRWKSTIKSVKVSILPSSPYGIFDDTFIAKMNFFKKSSPAFSMYQYCIEDSKFVYFCPFTYRQQPCQYLLDVVENLFWGIEDPFKRLREEHQYLQIVTERVLSLQEEQNIRQLAMRISECLELCS